MIISKHDIDLLFDLAHNAYPQECCGLLVGSNEQVDRVFPSQNVSQGDKTKTFEVDPKVRFKIIRETGERSLLGLFHSHPNGAPYPSDTDKAMVYEPELLWVILTLEEIKAFRFVETKQDFEEIPIQVKL